MKELKNMSTNELKKEYVTLALGNMIYDVDTKIKREMLSAEIERRENNKKWRIS